MDPALTLAFSALDRAQIRVAGGKAANLGELTRAGFPVPPGFCVTTAAYALVAAGSSLGPILEDLAGVPEGDADRLASLAERARQALLDAPVPPAVEAACREATRALGADVAVAVRSSATAEDLPDASFAGQQDTILNVVGEDAVIAAIRRCWASLFTDRAVVYRAKHGIDPRSVELAVAVQRLVPAAVAGVLFTADPVTGHRGRAVIDGSPGLGEAVVSGAVNPDHFVADKATGAILEQRLGDKKVSIEAIAGGGTRRIDRAAGGDACISPAEIAALVRLGNAVEAHYGAPQDLEWALDADRTPWLLQARPITTLFPLPAPRGEGLRVFFSMSVAQGVLRPITPMGISAFRLVSTGIATLVGFPPEDPMRGVAAISDPAGRLFFDITSLLESDVGRGLVRFVTSKMEARSSATLASLLADDRLPVHRTPRGWVVRRALDVARRTRLPLAMARTLLAPEGAPARAEANDRAVRALSEVPAGASTQEKLDAVEQIFRGGIRETFLRIAPLFVPGFLCLALSRRLLRGIATDDEIDVTLRALPHNPTTEMDLALWHLSAKVRKDAASVEALTGTAPSDLARRHRDRALPPVLEAELDAFLERYGLRGVAEIDVGVARWEEDPTHILGSLANYLAVPDEGSTPDVQFKRAEAEAEAMVQDLTRRARDRSLLRGVATSASLRRVRLLSGFREVPKFQMVQSFGRARRLLLQIGADLVRAEKLSAAADIFFLSIPEVQAAVGGRDQRELARDRRAVHAREVGRRHVPRILLSDGTEPAAPTSSGDAHLSGTPASAGTVRAKARVVLDPTGARIEPGEILVAPSTDPGWTPLFLTAAGLVMEMGGSMSHGAVVAREYGIPAVVGVADATARITTGQVITVDGVSGTVSL